MRCLRTARKTFVKGPARHSFLQRPVLRLARAHKVSGDVNAAPADAEVSSVTQTIKEYTRARAHQRPRPARGVGEPHLTAALLFRRRSFTACGAGFVLRTRERREG